MRKGKADESPDDELTVAEAAPLIYNARTGRRGVSRFRVWQMITADPAQLEARRVGRLYVIRRASISALDGRADGRPKSKGDQQ